MQDQYFDRPVFIQTGRLKNVLRGVKSTASAADWLLNKWPEGKAGERHLAARKACMAVLQGQKKAAVARQAFKEAAKEAEILAIEDY